MNTHDMEIAMAVLDHLKRLREEFTGKEVPETHHGYVTGTLEKACGSKEGRYRLLKTVYGYRWPEDRQVSSKDLTDVEWYVLARWCNKERMEQFTNECGLVMEYLNTKFESQQPDIFEWNFATMALATEQAEKEGRRIVGWKMACGCVVREWEDVPVCRVCCANWHIHGHKANISAFMIEHVVFEGEDNV